MFIRTTAINKILKLNKFVKGIQGGTSAGKTFAIIPIIINKCVKNNLLEVSVVAESIPHLKRGAIKDFKKIMVTTGRWVDSRWNASDFKYTFANGSTIEFFSADNDSKLRGARRDVLYMNECNNMTFHAYTELASRTKLEVYLDWNPTNEFWFHNELKDDDDVDFIILNYQDNEACPESALNFILKAKEKANTSDFWRNWYKVYGLGEIGSLQGVVFNNWKTIDFVPAEAKLVGRGMDFGYTNDPTTMVDIYQLNGGFIFDEVLYKTGLTNPEIWREFKSKNLDNSIYTIADSAEPKSIKELTNLGMRIKGAEKGKDSILFGIQKMQEHEFKVTQRSINLIKELRSYSWDKDREGNQLNRPQDNNNHCFVGDTLITTINGDVPISEIKQGDLVLTSEGFKKVLKKFNNGHKQVYKYSMQLDTFFVHLKCTNNHKVKTSKKWKEIKDLKLGNKLFHLSNLTEKHTTCIKEKDIIVKELQGCIEKFGGIIKEKYQKDITYTMLMEIARIIELKTLIFLKQNCILDLKVKRDLKIIQILQKIFILKELSQQKNGINQKKEGNGINNMEKNVGLIKSIELLFVKYVQKNIKLDIQEFQNTAIKTARLLHYEEEENLKKELVYDLMIEDCHEYFANGILVHNCIDAIRYFFLSKPNSVKPKSRLI
jgi:phage terminase large subunit